MLGSKYNRGPFLSSNGCEASVHSYCDYLSICVLLFPVPGERASEDCGRSMHTAKQGYLTAWALEGVVFGALPG